MVIVKTKNLVHKPTNRMSISTGGVFPIKSLIIFSN